MTRPHYAKQLKRLTATVILPCAIVISLAAGLNAPALADLHIKSVERLGGTVPVSRGYGHHADQRGQ
jgi:hypothetical protein